LVVTWQDRRDGASTSVYAQRVGPSGAALWAPDGVAISTQETYVPTPRVFVDGAHAFVLWRDVRSGGWAIYAQRVGLDGTRAFAQDGVPLSTNPKGGHYDWTGIGDGSGGLLVAFRLGTAGVNADIHTKRLAADGSLGTPLDGGTDAGIDASDAGVDASSDAAADSSRDAGAGDAASDAAAGGSAGDAGGAGARGGTAGSGATAGTASGGGGTGGRASGGTGTGGSTAGTSSGGAGAPPRKQPDEGCGCRVPASGAGSGAVVLLGLLLVAGVRRAKRRARSR
jgi:MYXO-CTERM domain-containing protein